jgi:LAO/AO transport system kinase
MANEAPILAPADRGLLERASAGDKHSIARLLTRAERDGDEFAPLHAALFPRVGRAIRVGITGPPGAGKSTLVERYALLRREQGERVAVVAVDPSSPFTGGALLGDRVRMNRIALDPGCFVRSMASRGSFGGLARTTDEVADCLDAVGFDRVVLETVGVGQSEVDVARAADCTVVVLVPGAGDAVQAMKAGLMEIADVFVVNKADRPGVERVLAELEEVLELRADGKRPAVVETVASNGEGIPRLDAAIDDFVAASRGSGEFEARRRRNLETKVHRIVEDGLRERLFAGKGLAARAAEALAERQGAPPYAVAAVLLREAGIESTLEPGRPEREGATR